MFTTAFVTFRFLYVWSRESVIVVLISLNWSIENFIVFKLSIEHGIIML